MKALLRYLPRKSIKSSLAELMDQFIVEMTATGGAMILALGLNLMGLTKIRVANLLPSVIVTGVIVTILYFYNYTFKNFELAALEDKYESGSFGLKCSFLTLVQCPL